MGEGSMMANPFLLPIWNNHVYQGRQVVEIGRMGK